MKKIEALLMTVIVLMSAFALVMPVTAQDTVVSIEDVSLGVGESKAVPIMIENVTGVVGAMVSISYNSSVVHITGVANSEFCPGGSGGTLQSVKNNTVGSATIMAQNYTTAGLTGDVKLAEVTLEAKGDAGDWSYLNLTIEELYQLGEVHIDATPDNGTFTVLSDTTAPIVENPSADPLVIPDDTDNEPLWGETSNLSVNVTDESEIASVTINLSAIGGGSKEPMGDGSGVAVMFNSGNYTVGSTLWTVYNCTTNASEGTSGWNETLGTYVPYCLPVNATDIYGKSNTSVCINLTVMKNGDVSENGAVTSYDAYHLSMWLLEEPGLELIKEVADVSGNGAVTSYDAYHLSMWLLEEPGLELK